MPENTTIQLAESRLRPIAEAYHINLRWLRVRIHDYFGTLDFTGQKILEVGAGNGLYACALSALGAVEVTAIEPEAAGAREHVSNTLLQNAQALNLTNLRFINASLQEFSAPVGRYDTICMLAVINHLDEENVKHLHYSAESQAIFQTWFRQMHGWLVPGGCLVVSDVSSYHPYSSLIRAGILHRHPFQPSINWEIHQPPQVWQALFKESGFVRIRYHWATNWRYAWMPRILTDNGIMSRLYSSLFVLSAYKPQDIQDLHS